MSSSKSSSTDRESPPETEPSFSGVPSNDFGDFGGVSSAGGVWHGDSVGRIFPLLYR